MLNELHVLVFITELLNVQIISVIFQLIKQVAPPLNKSEPHRHCEQFYIIFRNSVKWFLWSRRFVNVLILDSMFKLNVQTNILAYISAYNESGITTYPKAIIISQWW